MNFPLALGIPTNGAEWLLIFLVILLLFGSKKLPELARGLGKSMQEFRKAREDFESEIHSAKTELTVAEPQHRQLHQNTSAAATAAMSQNDELQRQVRELQEQLRTMQTQNPGAAPMTNAVTPAEATVAAATNSTGTEASGGGVLPVELTPVEPGAKVPPPVGSVPVKLG